MWYVLFILELKVENVLKIGNFDNEFKLVCCLIYDNRMFNIFLFYIFK